MMMLGREEVDDEEKAGEKRRMMRIRRRARTRRTTTVKARTRGRTGHKEIVLAHGLCGATPHVCTPGWAAGRRGPKR